MLIFSGDLTMPAEHYMMAVFLTNAMVLYAGQSPIPFNILLFSRWLCPSSTSKQRLYEKHP